MIINDFDELIEIVRSGVEKEWYYVYNMSPTGTNYMECPNQRVLLEILEDLHLDVEYLKAYRADDTDVSLFIESHKSFIADNMVYFSEFNELKAALALAKF